MQRAMTTIRVVFRVFITNPPWLTGDDPQQNEKRDNGNQDYKNDRNDAGRIPDNFHHKPP
jgi:hypothetical protein